MDDQIRKKIQVVLLISTVCVLTLISIVLITRYAYVKVNIETSSDESRIITVTNENGDIVHSSETDTDTISFFTRREHLVVYVEQAKKKSFTETEVGYFNTTNVDIELVNQKSSKKIASDSGGCHSRDNKNQIYSYSCLGGDDLYRHQINTNGPYKQSQETLTGFASTKFYEYQNGLVFAGIEEGATFLTYYDFETRKISELFVDEGDAEAFSSTIDVSNSGKKLFYTDDSNKTFVFNGKEKVAEVDLLEGIQKQDRAINHLSSNDELLLYYHGLSGITPDSEEESKTYSDYKGGQLKLYDLDDYSYTLIKTPKDFLPTAIHYITGSQFITENIDDSITFYRVEGDKLIKEDTYTSIESVPLINNAGFYFVGSDNNLYFFDLEKELAQLYFAEENLKISSVNQSGGDLFFSAFTQDTGALQYLFGYELLVNKDVQYPRLESVLPYSRADVPIRAMDYQGNKIYVHLLLTSLSYDKSTGEAFFDREEFNANKTEFINRFKRDGFNPKNYSIKFYY